MGRLDYNITMKTEVATYWYDKFKEFTKQNPEDFGNLTFAAYLGGQVLSSMKLLFEGVVPEVKE